MNNEELAYTAGLVDGEGYLGIRINTNPRCKRGFHYSAVVKISMTHEGTIRLMREWFGGHISHRVFTSERDWKDAWEWSISNAKPVAEFLKHVRPWLRIKAAQADLLIDFSAHHMNVWGKNGVSDEEHAVRTAAYERIRALNHRGRPQRLSERTPAPTG